MHACQGHGYCRKLLCSEQAQCVLHTPCRSLRWPSTGARLQKKWLTLGYRHPPPPPPPPPPAALSLLVLHCDSGNDSPFFLKIMPGIYLSPWGLSKTTTTQQCHARVDPL
ncbi:uncharacterized protein BO66DRAFT_233566 [Aspergillus aculeatinus CBS 121060]|uniref:Uncharacterized protein n=1 Tax=Aspergillus aculeatinus CBS 121060 TaxID=1448322 RepID=A0ACD1GTY3_9EURO|nr:hypothetical protein BO66DRAFT_233566 [Aspergillus aculeatinus CBS 121060]RAH64603.1 hypothetical protein BO66DRAFT_233566 [Aspergillus aculeatinus CBS 121060]